MLAFQGSDALIRRRHAWDASTSITGKLLVWLSDLIAKLIKTRISSQLDGGGGRWL